MSKQVKRSGLMQKRTLKVALLAVLAMILVLGFSAVALADQTWSDLPDTVTAKYGITDNQVAGISDGFPDGLWRPYQSVTRAQFTKMAVAGFRIPLGESGHRVLHGRSQRQPSTTSTSKAPKPPAWSTAPRHHLQPQRPHHPAAGHRHRVPLDRPGERLSIWPPCTRPMRSPPCSPTSATRPASARPQGRSGLRL